MKIGFFISSCPKCAVGGVKVVYEYANYLSNKGHEVCIYFDGRFIFKRKFLLEPIRRIIVFIVVKFIRPTWFDLSKKIKKNVLFSLQDSKFKDADIIIATDIDSTSTVNKLPMKKGNKAYFIQGFENWNCSDEEVYATYNLGMKNIVVAKWLKDIVDQHSNTPPYLVSNCINTIVFYDMNKRRVKHSIVFHYRFADYKGPQYALEAIQRLKDKYDDLVVDVISIEDKPDNLPSYCTYHHNISAEEIADINNRTQVFMCTSIEEGFGLPGLEAMACGCAVVSTSYRGVLEYVVDGENALLSPVRDVDAMVNNIIKLFEDDELRKKITKNGIKTGKERSLENSATEFERILRG